MNYKILVPIIGIVLLLTYRIYSSLHKRQEFNRINGRLDSVDFLPMVESFSKKLWVDDFSPRSFSEMKFDWEETKSCFGNVLERKKFKDHSGCPTCGLRSEQLVWIRFSSSVETWKNLCGQAGPLSICPKCKIQVEFVMEFIN